MAATETADVVSTLDELIETCRDGASGFRAAAEHARNPILNAQFNSYAQQRDLFAAELEAAVQARGGKAEETGSVAGAVHRGWVSLRSVLTGLDDATILAECIRGEDAALRSYEQALAMGLPSDLRIIAERQRWAIQESRHHLHGLMGMGAHIEEGERGFPGAGPKRARRRMPRRRGRRAPTVRKRARTSPKSAQRKRKLAKKTA